MTEARALAALEAAIITAAAGVLTRRAAALTECARKASVIIEDKGREVTLVDAEVSVMLGTAALFRQCADDVLGLLPTAVVRT